MLSFSFYLLLLVLSRNLININIYQRRLCPSYKVVIKEKHRREFPTVFLIFVKSTINISKIYPIYITANLYLNLSAFLCIASASPCNPRLS